MFITTAVMSLFKVSLGTGEFEHQAEENLKWKKFNTEFYLK
jgi:hypothetical protein